jgi:hypothetical protein
MLAEIRFPARITGPFAPKCPSQCSKSFYADVFCPQHWIDVRAGEQTGGIATRERFQRLP